MTPGQNDALVGGIGENAGLDPSYKRKLEAATEKKATDAAVIGALRTDLREDLKRFGARQYVGDD